MSNWIIKEIDPHEGPHVDEAASAVLARRWGKNVFGEGIATAPVVPKALTGTEDEWLQRGHLPLGQLRGRFDDKNPDGERIEGTCCALRMAQFLKIERMPELERFFRAVNRVDSNANATPTDISSLIKDGNASVAKDNQSSVFTWAEKGITAVIDYFLKPSACTDYVRAGVVFEDMITKGEVKEKRVIARMRKFLLASEKQIDSCIEVSFILRAMKATGVPDDVAICWIKTGLQWSIKQQEQFWAAVSEVEKSKAYPIDPRRAGEKLAMLMVHSDNPQIAKASRSKNYAVCIVRRSNGGVAIIPNGVCNLDMRGVRALVRMEETPASERSGIRFEEYAVAGNHPGVPHWHAMETALLNGSNHISAKPTALSDETLIEIVRIGFGPEAGERFREMGGVTDSTFIDNTADVVPQNTTSPDELAAGRKAMAELELAFKN